MSETPEETYPSARYAWYVVVVLFLAYVVSFLDRQILSLLIEPIKEDLELSDTMISLLQGFAFAIFYTIVGIPIGRLADRRNGWLRGSFDRRFSGDRVDLWNLPGSESGRGKSDRSAALRMRE